MSLEWGYNIYYYSSTYVCWWEKVFILLSIKLLYKWLKTNVT